METKKRAGGLYSIDTKKKIRSAEESIIIKKIYKEFLTNEHIIHSVCHTKYCRKKKEVYPQKITKQ